MAKFVVVGHSHQSTRHALSKKVAIVVIHKVARLFICLFQVLVVVYTTNLVQLIALYLPAGPPQLVILAAYDATRFQPIVVFVMKNVAMNHSM